jgi:hypothetical protein
MTLKFQLRSTKACAVFEVWHQMSRWRKNYIELTDSTGCVQSYALCYNTNVCSVISTITVTHGRMLMANGVNITIQFNQTVYLDVC